MHSAVTGEPASITDFSDDKSKRAFGTMPAFSRMPTYVGLAPKNAAPLLSTMLQSTSGSGYAGFLSDSTGTTSTSIAHGAEFHIIQHVVVKKNIRAPACTSMWNFSDLHCSRIMAPWQWMMGFGNPVVPEENK